MQGVTVDSLAILTDVAGESMPKLLRRLVDYLSINNGDVSLAGLPPTPPAGTTACGRSATASIICFDNVFVVDGQNRPHDPAPEDLVFIEGSIGRRRPARQTGVERR